MNKLFYTFFSGLLLMSLASCKKNNIVVGKDIQPPAFAKFSTYGAGDTTASYFIKSTNEPFKIPVGITNVTNEDRTIQFTYSSSTAIQGQQYSAPATIVIPAGKALDSLAITGVFSSYDPGRIDTLQISIAGGVAPGPYKSHYTLYLQKYCDVDLNSFVGTYANCIDDGSYGPYTIEVISATSTGSTSGYLMIGNLWDAGGSTPIRVDLDWSDPSKFAAAIPAGQKLYVDPDYGQAFVKPNGSGTFNSCENTFTLKYQVYVSVGGFPPTSTVMKR